MTDKKKQTIKLLIVGDSGVGKTSLLMRYCENKFHTDFLSTVGVDFKVKKIETQTHLITLNIWDTAGQERFRNITKNFYKGAHGVILVYSIVDERSFEHIQSWIQQVKDNGSPTANMILVGSKLDLEHDRKVPKKDGKTLAHGVGINFVESSAKENQNIAKVFEELARQIVGSLNKSQSTGGKKLQSKKKQHQKEGCC